jgi:hypothetical protein
MLALLETRLPRECHIHKTSIHENGVTVSVKKEQGEIIRFFLADHQQARACFAMHEEGIKCCDYLLIYTSENNQNQREILCFIELKGKDLRKAGKQICDTHQYITEFARQFLDNKLESNVTKAAVIFLHERVPSGKSWREREKLARIFDENCIYIKHAVQRNCNFGQFIRNIYA